MALFLSLSVSAARISTVLDMPSRLPGFIGLVPPPTLDKNHCVFMNLSNNFVEYGKCTLNYDSLCRCCQSFFSKQPETPDPFSCFDKTRLICQQTNAHIAFAVLAKTDAWGDRHVYAFKQYVGKLSGR